MTYKRYIEKDGKKTGPYYYYNLKDKEGQLKTIYLGTKRPSSLNIIHIIIILFFFLIIAGGTIFLSNVKVAYTPEDKLTYIETDQTLIKVLLKQGDSITKELSIMNVGDSTFNVGILREGVGNLLAIKEDSFELLQGETKTIVINFATRDLEKGITYSPGVYVGKLLIKSEKETKAIPVIVEVESKEVLFDMNIDFNAQDRVIEQGDSRNVEIRLFNLGKVGPANVLMDYGIKSLNGETIFTETETVVVVTQASFYKTIKIPENLNTGEYVFIVKAKYGNSVGTSSYLFEVKAKEIKKSDAYYKGVSGFLNICSGDPKCWISLLVLVLFLFILGSYTYFFIGAYIYSKVNKNFLFRPTHEFKLERIHEKHPVKHHKAWPFILIAVILSLITVGVFYYEQLFPKFMFYLSRLRAYKYIELTPDLYLYIKLIGGGLIILSIILFAIRHFTRKRN